MKESVGYFTLKASQLVGELDRLFICELDGWLPIPSFGIEVISQERANTVMIIRPTNWPDRSCLSCRFSKIDDSWRLIELTIKAPHIHNTAIGGIDITLSVCDLPGITIYPPKEFGNPAADIVSDIILRRYPTSLSKFN